MTAADRLSSKRPRGAGQAASLAKRVWPALLLTPPIALTDLSVAYSLVGPACSRNDPAILHAVALASVVLCAGMTALAWRAWSRDRPSATGSQGSSQSDRAFTAEVRGESSAADERPAFLALVATLVGALSSLVCAALWVLVWLLAPCV